MAEGIALAVFIRKRGATPGILQKERGRVQKDAFHGIGARWHKEFLGKHFENSAYSRYPGVYQPRKGERGSGRHFKGSYTAKKLRMFGHTRPLVYTGESLRLAKIRDVRATSKGAAVRLKSRKLNFRHPKSKVKMSLEVRAFNRAEILDLREYFDKRFQRGIGLIRQREERKVA